METVKISKLLLRIAYTLMAMIVLVPLLFPPSEIREFIIGLWLGVIMIGIVRLLYDKQAREKITLQKTAIALLVGVVAYFCIKYSVDSYFEPKVKAIMNKAQSK